ncbi:MAG: hypothetical protein DCC71_11055 [Proteobacteria bacterium]|nr:MAG: hypothetical protein DCC71_11055 [Pseudomonadota bacterium]
MRTILAAGVLAFALAPSASAAPFNLGNFVWHDANTNGIRDAGEPGVPGVTVQLVTADRKQILAQATTNASGGYSVAGEGPGAFRLRVLPPPGWQITRMDFGADDTEDSDVHPYGPDFRYTEPLAVAPNLISNTSLDVGLVQPTTTAPVGNLVWNDADGDGVQDGGEPGIAGVQVELWDAPKTTRLAVTTTSLLGIYAFDAPAPGLVRVRVIPPAGMEHTPKGAGEAATGSDVWAYGPDRSFSDPFHLGVCCGTTAIDAGLVQPVSPVQVGNRVWLDADADGIQDAGEAGVAGVVVELWDAARTQRLDTDVTDANGVYAVTGAVPGGFRLRVVAPGGHQYAPADAGGDDTVDSDVDGTSADAGWSHPFFLGSNVISVTNRDAGLVLPAALANVGNQLWLDLDYDGVREAGETSVQGATVELWDASMRELVDTDVTDANGVYWVEALVPGAYRVRVPLAADSGIAFTRKDAGADDLVDSDLHPWGAEHGFSAVIRLGSNVISSSSHDAGLLPQAVPEPAALGAIAALLALCCAGRRARG